MLFGLGCTSWENTMIRTLRKELLQERTRIKRQFWLGVSITLFGLGLFLFKILSA